MPRTHKYEVIRKFNRRDKKTGDVTHYQVGDTYSGPDVEKYLKGVDDKGPLIREKHDPSGSEAPAGLITSEES